MRNIAMTILVVVVLPLSNAQASDYDVNEFPICTQTDTQSRPAIYGDIVVWQDYRNGNNDIYGYDLATEQEFPICTQIDHQEQPAIYGNIMVWMDVRDGNSGIYGYDLVAEQEFPICTEAASQMEPAIYGNIVVWQDYRNGNADIYGYDLVTEQEFPICTEASGQYEPAIYGDIVVWKDYRNGSSDIYGYDLVTEQEFFICDPAAHLWSGPAIYNNTMVWYSPNCPNFDSGIYGYDLVAEQEFPICTTAFYNYERPPAIYGNIVVWQDNRDNNSDIYGYDLVAEQEFDICTATTSQSSPAIYGNIVVWQDGRNGNSDIYMATLQPRNISLQNPNGGESLIGFQTYAISWLSEGSVSEVLIEYSADNGSNWDSVNPTNIGNTGSYDWSVPPIFSQQCLIRITDVENSNVIDTSDECFAVYTCQEQIEGDLNKDCKVDFTDFAIMASHWAQRNYLSANFDFDTDPNWTAQGQWEFGVPMGMGGSAHGNPDPNSGYTGTNVYGVNLNGDYTIAVGGPYCLTAGPFDCIQFDDMKLRFARWLNTDEPDYVSCKVEVSNDGNNWTGVWENTSAVTDSDWQIVEYDVSETADNEATVYFRWSYEILDSRAYPYSGWNIDDIELLGKL